MFRVYPKPARSLPGIPKVRERENGSTIKTDMKQPTKARPRASGGAPGRGRGSFARGAAAAVFFALAVPAILVVVSGCARFEASLALRRGEPARAVQILESRLREDPGSQPVLTALGRTLVHARRFEAALEVLAGVDPGYRGHHEAVFYQSLAHQGLGRTCRALETIRGLRIPGAYHLRLDLVDRMEELLEKEYAFPRLLFLAEKAKRRAESRHRAREREFRDSDDGPFRAPLWLPAVP
jgi:hypothetical protein